MDELSLAFFPYPHVYLGERRIGVLRSWPDRCFSCDRQCDRSILSGVQLCSYGVNYVRVNDQLLIAGVVVRDFPTTSSAFKKVRRRTGALAIASSDLERVIEALNVEKERTDAEIDREKKSIIEGYRESEAYKSEILDLLRPDVQRALAQVHDYRQLITQIVQNVNVIVLTKYPDDDFNSALDKNAHELQAIYWSARLMESKLEAALFLMYPEKIEDEKLFRVFKLHGLVLKYVRIYQRSFDEKGLTIKLDGPSYGSIRANPDAIGVIPHAFLDNAFKYSPQGMDVIVAFDEDQDMIGLSVMSYGPKIMPHEKAQIFDLFYRGENAVPRAVEGTGFGLALVNLVAQKSGVIISMNQSDIRGPEDSLLTTFSARFQRYN